MSKVLLRWDQVEMKTGLSYSTAHRKMVAGTFPRPTKSGKGPRALAFWVEEEIDAWIDAMLEERGDAYQQGPLDASGCGVGRGRKPKQQAEAAEVAA
jgi:predicted DNA-binding transcriptional regulator AlpA